MTWSLTAGGSERYAYLAASHVDPCRFRHVVCAVDQGGPMEGTLREAGIPYTVMGRREPGVDWGLMRRMYRYLKAEDARVVHTHHFNQLLYAGPPARLLGARLIYTEHCVELLSQPRIRVALRVLAGLCHRVTAVGEDVYQALLTRVRIPVSRLEIVRAGVDVDAFRYPRDRAREELDIAPDARVAIIIARLYPEKNHALLLRAFAEVAALVPGALLLIAGDGIEADTIRQRVCDLGLGERVRLLGVRTDVPRLLVASDVFVLCSDREGLPIAILEAMAAGLPVVATAVGDIPRVVQQGEMGYLVQAGDLGRLSEAIADCLKDPDRARRLGALGRESVAQGYSAQAMAAHLEALYC